MLKFLLRGQSGNENVRIIAGSEVFEGKLNKGWEAFWFTYPENGQFSVNFLNDDVTNNTVFIGFPLVEPEVYHNNFKVWNCNAVNDDYRCERVRSGTLAWGGEYMYTIKGG